MIRWSEGVRKLIARFPGRRCDASIRLRKAGASRELLRHVDGEGDILRAWDTCPRGSWGVELIARGGVPRSVTAHALVQLGEEYDEPLLETYASQYASGALDTDELVIAVDAALGGVIDAMEDVLAISAAANPPPGQQYHYDDVQRLAHMHDEAYAQHHAQMAKVLRRTVSREIVRSAFGVAGPGPYR